MFLIYFFFFFQAEDGIRDVAVTGVQTCALPISRPRRRGHESRAPPREGFGEAAACRRRPARPRARAPRRLRGKGGDRGARDRKSTRLNSSHGYISYAVFCLKKKRIRTLSCLT